MTEESRVALVTGGTQGLGRTAVERLLRDGWKVQAVSRTGVWEGEAPDALSVMPADVRDPSDCAAAVAEVLERWGRLDHLVNNAAAAVDVPMRDMTLDDWTTVLDATLTGSFLMAKAALDPVTSSRHGRIVNVGSVAGSMGSTWQVNYSAAKSGLLGFTRALAREVGRTGTTVNLVALGPTASGMSETTDPGYVDALVRKIPLRRLGSAADLAHAIRFLLDDGSGFITGSSLTVDGGLSMG